MSKHLDLSSFPLLRLDQLQLHEIDVLLQAKVELAHISQSNDHLGLFVRKLTDSIDKEVVRRTLERVTRLTPNPAYAAREISDFDPRREQNPFANTCNHLKVDDNRKLLKQETRNNFTKTLTTAVTVQHFVASPSANRKTNFTSRSREAVLSLKTKKEMMLNGKENRLKQLSQDKERRRNEAVERMNERRERQERLRYQMEMKAKAKQEVKEKRRIAKLKLIADMEEAAADATTASNDGLNKYISLEERHMNGAKAAIRVMEENSCDIASSNSGSSLASEVDIEPDMEVEEDMLSQLSDSRVTNGHNPNNEQNQMSPRVESRFCCCNIVDSKAYSSDASQSSESREDSKTQITSSDEDVEEDCEPYQERNQSSSCTRSHNSPDMKQIEMIISAQIPDEVYSTMNQNGDKNATNSDTKNSNLLVKLQNWKPWECISTAKDQTEKDKSTYNETSLSDVFPNFRNIFSAFFMNSSNFVTKELDYQRERECLEYQIKVGNSLSELISDNVEKFFIDKSKYIFKVKSPRTEVSSIVQDVLSPFQSDEIWEDVSNHVGIGNCWNLLWTWSKPKINREHLLTVQKISRFDGVSCLTRKDLLKKRLEQNQTTASLMPKTFVLPQQYNTFISSFTEHQRLDLTLHPNIWIMKPVGMSRGRGITIIDDIAEVAYASPTVIQKYVTNPLLFEGFKFDLRLYVLVTSFNPLEAFIYREGLARFGSKRFSTTNTNLKDLRIHLTNSSIQREYDDDILHDHPSRMAGKHGGGNKTRLTWLLNRLQKNGIDTTGLWNEISKVCLQTLKSVDALIINQPNSFEIFGFDVIIDSKMKPWLIEVNACPSMARDSLLDMDVKEALIRDTIKIIQPCKFNRSALFQICKRKMNQRKRTMRVLDSDRQELDRDLQQIFGDHMPRLFGELPKEDTDFERLAPVM
jgi:hypothetical protein